MVASVGRITAGDGYRYLTRDVARTPADYYAGRGEAPGEWAGRGAPLLGLNGEVDAEAMAVLYGRFVDPRTVGQIDASGAALPELVLGRRVSVRHRADGTTAAPVAAFDVTFSPSKSVSVLWATASDLRVRQVVVECHEQAVTEALEYLEHTAGHARTGLNGTGRIDTHGLVVARFRHRTARATASNDEAGAVADPQLHTHCAVLNRVRGLDGVWRTLDSKAVYRNAHAAGALYGAVLERELSARLVVSWQAPDGRVPMREVAGVPHRLVTLWSTRRRQVLASYERTVAAWQVATGRTPTRAERAGLLDAATLRSRAPKRHGHVDLHEAWQSQMAPGEQAQIDRVVAGHVRADAGRLPEGSTALLAAVERGLHEQRAWWHRAHVFAEIARLIENPTRQRVDAEVDRFLADCIVIDPDPEGASARWEATKYTSTSILAAERRVLDCLDQPASWQATAPSTNGRLGADQREAVDAITAGRSQVSVVIGPAGAGKTTLLAAVANTCAAARRPVLVMALSAAAARVVSDETGLPASTIASWSDGGLALPADGLVIIDEASMVPTLTLDRVIATAARAGSRVALIGDYAQMSAPEAGGLLRDLGAAPEAVHLTGVRRFRNDWEKAATIALRNGDATVADTYAIEGRLVAVTSDTATVSVARAWHADHAAGLETLIVVDTAAAAADLSALCQARRAVDHELGPIISSGADHNPICIGDIIQTRHNTSRLITSDGQRILNRDTWRVTGARPDGSLEVAHTRRNATAVITPDYTRQHVVLAYATTLAGAQGRTVDTCHTVVTPRTTAAQLYVGMTRGRLANHAHVVTDGHDHDEFELGDRTVVDAFRAAIQRDPDSQLSATSVRYRAATLRQNDSRHLEVNAASR